MGRDSSVGIATTLRAGRSVDRTRWGARYSATIQTGPGAYTAAYTMGTGSFPRVKRTRRGVDHPPTSIAEVKVRVELHICSFSGPSWSVTVWNFTQVFGDVTPRALVNRSRHYGEAQCCLIQGAAVKEGCLTAWRRIPEGSSLPELRCGNHISHQPFTVFIFSSPINSWFHWSR